MVNSTSTLDSFSHTLYFQLLIEIWFLSPTFLKFDPSSSTATPGLGLIFSPGTLLYCSVTQSCLTPGNPMDCSTPGFPVLHYFLEFAQTHVHGVGDATQSLHPLSSPSPLALSLSQHQNLFQWVSSSHQVAKILEFQLQHQCFKWIFKTDEDWLAGSPCSQKDSQVFSNITVQKHQFIAAQLLL